MRKTPCTIKDITDKTFGYWTVLYRVDNRYGKVYYHCRCRCGVERDVCSQKLRTGQSTSCGCFGMQRTPRYISNVHGKAWTAEEIAILRKYYPINGSRGCVKLLNRTAQAIGSRAKKLGLMSHARHPRKDQWSDGEIERLKKLYTEGGIRACRGQFKFRTEQSIKTMAYELGLKVKNGRYSPRGRLNKENNNDYQEAA